MLKPHPRTKRPTPIQKRNVALESLFEKTKVFSKKKNKRCVLHSIDALGERWGAGVETQKNVRGEIGGWGRVPFNEPYAPLLSTIYDGA